VKPYAAIDIGSQTIRLLVARPDAAGGLVPLRRDRSIIRLGEGMLAGGALSAAAMARAVACIARFADTAHSCGVARIFAVATACVRSARNAAVFLDRVVAETGIRPRVLSGRDEARMMLCGVRSAVAASLTPPVLVMDIGGGSTEFIAAGSAGDPVAESIPLGVIALAERHLRHDPPHRDDIAAAGAAIDWALGASTAIPLLQTCSPPPVLVGTAGTVTTLAAMDQHLTGYDPQRINGYGLSRARLEALLQQMLSLPLCERARLPGLEDGRALVIVPGTLAVLAVMRRLACSELLVSDAGLIEGALLRLSAEHP
jgi:exopolyphosphatase/guanosine-5'-triphosphate,3'-diphosphate pyrophosphatase